MLKRMVLMLIIVGLVFAAIFGFQAFKGRMIQKAIGALGNQPQTVSTITAKFEKWLSTIEAVGTIRAVNGANLSAEVAGIVSAIHFRSGADVEKGTLLVQLDAAADIAHLNALKATAAQARANYERDKALLKTEAVSQQTAENDKWTLATDEAQVAQQQALVNHKSVIAPFSGRLGIRQVDVGQYIAPGAPIVTVQQLDPIYVDFYLPQQSLAKIEVGQGVTAKVDTYKSDVFTGKVSAINSQVDTATRNVQVRATIANPDKKLLPGMFATIDINIGEPQHYVTLPQTAIAYNSYGDIVYLVEKSSGGTPPLVAHQSFVTTGPTRGDQVAVLSGVNPGDTVVTAGQVKLHNGSPVQINNSVQPANSPNPAVPNE